MSSPSDSLDGPLEMHETKSDVRQDVPPGESIGHRPEDQDLSQFGYKAELEVRDSLIISPRGFLTLHSDDSDYGL